MSFVVIAFISITNDTKGWSASAEFNKNTSSARAIADSVQFPFAMAKAGATKKAVGIVSKPNKPEVAQIMPGLIEWLRGRGRDLLVDPETAPHADGCQVVTREEMGDRDLEFVIVLGGDGTLLSAARAVAKSGIPILGVNLGALGFLTEIPLEEIYPTLESIDQGAFALDVRSMVHCDLKRDSTIVASYEALNDVVVGKAAIARLNHCDVFIDGKFVSRYQADSVIVSTPTGSTAYSLAAGGPILSPRVEAFVLTPVSAHSLTHRPLVVRDTSEIEIVVMTGKEEAYLSVDGQSGMPIQDADRVVCMKSRYHVKLLHTKGTFFDVLHSKLKWGQR